MKYHQLPKGLFEKNRQKLADSLPKGGMAIIHSNWETPRNGDAFFAFRQQSDLFYLTGIDQEDTIYVSFPDCPNPMFKECVFVKETNAQIAVWDGARLNPEQVYERSGISSVFWYHEFWQTIHSVILMAESIGVNLNENDRFTTNVPYSNIHFTKQLKDRYPVHNMFRLAPTLARLRMSKEEEEIELLKEAISITRKGLYRALQFIKPGVMEYEVEAEIIHEFIKNRSKGFAFDPIMASGESACVLHYIENNKPLKDGDLMLLDFGAEYANYNGDLTRCIPVNGKFSKRQKEVYDAVLDVQRYAKSNLKPGVTLPDYHGKVCAYTNEKLVELGLFTQQEIKDNPKSYLKYFMHGTSHHLGLDVHDVMHRFEPIPDGSVLTIEPGIYIPEEEIGVRIENDVVLQGDKIIDLMEDFPIKTEEIEDAMNP
ncbi:MAG: Xaa-Pro aminopeptidase [Bacteroidia bacterium]|jgi:Xaa-Pro aminopeptidase|nr:Xaa-Pro aminopeptidase [Bacteroidia bacterium]